LKSSRIVFGVHWALKGELYPTKMLSPDLSLYLKLKTSKPFKQQMKEYTLKKDNIDEKRRKNQDKAKHTL
jgi:hypothetical protein